MFSLNDGVEEWTTIKWWYGGGAGGGAAAAADADADDDNDSVEELTTI